MGVSAATSDEDQSRSETFIAFLAWPILTLMLLAFPFMAAQAISSELGEDFDNAVKLVARWLGGSADECAQCAGGFDTAPGFGYLAVVAAIAIGLAFSLPPGGVRDLPIVNQRLVVAIVIGIPLTAAVLSATVIWNMLAGTTSLEMFLLLAGAWLVSLLTSIVDLKRSTRHLLQQAEREWERYSKAAEKKRIFLDSAPNIVRFGPAWLLFWIFPLLASVLLPYLGLVLDLRGGDIPSEAWAFLFAVPISVYSLQCAFPVAYPPRPTIETGWKWLAGLFGSSLLVIIVIAAGMAQSWALLASVLLVAIAQLLLTLPEFAEQFSYIRVIRLAATVKRLERAHDWLVQVRKMYELECAAARKEEAAQPLVRVEIFRRRPKKMGRSGDSLS